MKNIHILSADKPSWLVMDTKKNKLYFSPSLQQKTSNFLPQNIYITSDEEIKEGDWYYYFGHIINYDYDEHTLTPNCKKIILTTDKDLIKDGVQSIHYTFLEWFVNNPSCEEVEVELKTKQLVKPYDVYNEIVSYYKIIIPKEEPKQERMYSEEEVYHILCEHTAFLFAGGKSTLTDWVEQFKKL